MALQKMVTTLQGFSADYHRIERSVIDHKTGGVTVELFTYKDETARQAGALFTGARSYTVTLPPVVLQAATTAFYNALKDAIVAKGNDELKGAVDA